MSHQDYVGRSETREDRLDPRLLRGMAATLGLPIPAELPPLWHWMFFQDWVMPEGIGPDGHPKRGGFLPPVHDLPRRMWAGGRLRFHPVALHADDIVTRTSTILKVEEKSGGSGRLVFVTVGHLLHGPAGLAVEEEQDIVYRGAEGAAVKPAAAAAAWPEASSMAVMPDPVMLFRYSALTGNGHRIHYDHPYVTGEEGYPGLVVHGPLQATLMAQHALAQSPGKRLHSFAFRGRRPAFDSRALTVLGRVEGDQMRLETRDDGGATCMQAEAELADTLA
ncbi:MULTISPECIES: FAS1-like dehydratase domain-containing protein [Roseomonadaceae]|uniref:MaoC family dehydratase N-terminal domain-containing protein n=1 Tax=Falsiroseomonas oleicola TaxID=2801474 RepID=A0ABS6H6V8_9PROT|nr:MaoC family dehydratase N-terminal domain-containing protein [Roseomonas oleicola]MBU8544101.1 MaoC family dehydratase N-terminal domain-containing protein [Roseomonas oleicola]